MVKKMIASGIRSGKTTKIAKWTKENNGVMIVINESWAKEIRAQFDLRDDQVMSFEAVKSLKGLHKFRDRPIAVDNADWILSELLNLRRPIDVMAIDMKKE